MTIDKLTILFESVRSKFDFVSNADNALDGKAAALMGFEIAVAIGYWSFALSGLDGTKFWEGVSGLILLGISTGLLFYVNWPKDYITISVNLFEHKDYLAKTEEALLLQLISDAQNAFTENNKILGKKARWYKLAIILLLLAAILLILSKTGKFYV